MSKVMSGIKLIDTSLFGSRALLTLLALFLISTKVSNANGQPEPVVETVDHSVDVYKCQGANPELIPGTEIHVPSYAFNSTVVLRIVDKLFPGCDSPSQQEATETELLFVPEEPPVEEIADFELTETTISPGGVLNVRGHFYNVEEYCILDYAPENHETEVPSLKIQYCSVNCSNSGGQVGQHCVRKCCPAGKVVDLHEGQGGYSCQPSGSKSWSAFYYDEVSWKRPSKNDERNQAKKTHYFRDDLMKEVCNATGNESFLDEWFMRDMGHQTKTTSRLLTNGQLITISTHRRWTLFETTSKFCIDGIQNFDGSPHYSGDEEDQVVFICDKDVVVEEADNRLSILYMYALFIASVFYLATVIVYGLLWDKQNTHGWIVFSLVLSKLFMSFFIGNAHRMGLVRDPETRNSGFCIANAILAHFFLLASFTWLSVINFDLWLTFRLLRTSNRKSVESRKFSLYSVIGWGVPLIVVILGVIMDHYFPDRESLILAPEYGQNICYVAEWAQGAYIYYIIAVLLGITVTLSILTFAKIYKFHKDTAHARSSSTGDQQIFILYAKLSVVLGTSWIFEFISWAASSDEHQHWIWTVFDMYNLLTAVFIFIIFVCKRAIFTQLADKYSCLSCLKPNGSWTSGKQSDPAGPTASSTVTQQPGVQEVKMYVPKGDDGFQ